ncbi:hypothetical protein [Primorskyibacter sp. S187A]|uniref:hypothetical protein n=1 Tax=Primorskyibacter sp. S187A TaxID=3415130 RepID=UPI003C7A1BFF
MVLVMMIAGAVLGTITAVFAWAALGTSLLVAFAIYMSGGLIGGLVGAVASYLRPEPASFLSPSSAAMM